MTPPRRASAAGVPGRLAAILLLGACTNDSARNTAPGGDASGAAEVAEAAAPAFPTPDSGLAWTIDSAPVTRIGDDDRDSAQHYRYVFAARRLSDGRVVLATDKGEVRWFGADGRFTGIQTRVGDGPGEFRYIGTLLRLADDTVLVADSRGFRVALFSPDGRLLRHESIDYDRYRRLGRWAECRTQVLADRSIVSCQGDPTIPVTASNRPNRLIGKGMTSPGPGHLRQLRRTLVASPSLDTAYRLGIETGIEQYGVRTGSREEFVVHPFYATSHLAAGGSPLRIASATNPEYRVEVWTPDGRLERVLTRARARRAPTRAERADVPRLFAERNGRRHDDATRARLLAAVPTPDSLPAIGGLLVGDGGEILVRRWGTDVFGGSTTDVYAADGRWLGVLRLPSRSGLMELGREHLVLVRYTEDDVPLVEVHRLRR